MNCVCSAYGPETFHLKPLTAMCNSCNNVLVTLDNSLDTILGILSGDISFPVVPMKTVNCEFSRVTKTVCEKRCIKGLL